MAELRQGDNGKWTIKNLYHNKPGVKIPATFTYNGYPVSFEIESSPKTIETPWETSLGTSINLADIDRRYSEVVDEAACKKYVVRLNTDEHFTIKPYQEDPYIFQLSPQSIELESTATTQTFTVTATNVSDIGWDSQNSVNVTAGAANSTSATANFTQNTSTTESKGIVFAISGKTSGGRTIRENAAITLKKSGDNYEFRLSPSETTAESTQVSKAFTVTATNVTNVGYASSLSTGLTGGTANSTSATARFSQNESTSPSTKVFVITAKTETERVIQTSATIVQQGIASEYYIRLSNPEDEDAFVNVPCSGFGTKTINLLINLPVGTDWYAVADDGASWINITKNSDNVVVSFTDNNEGGGVRTSQITICDTVGQYEHVELQVKQNACGQPTYSLAVNVANGYSSTIDSTGTTKLVATYYDGLGGSTAVTTSATWEVTSGNSYIDVNNTGSNKGTVTGKNANTNQETCKVKATYNGHQNTVTITVRPKNFAVLVNECGDPIIVDYTQGTYDDDCIYVSANTYWHFYTRNPDDSSCLWLSAWPVNGNSTESEPGGKMKIQLSKWLNEDITYRDAILYLCQGINIGDHDYDYGHLNVRQTRGESNISITGSAVNVSYLGATISLTVASNQAWKFTDMSGLTPDFSNTGSTRTATTGTSFSFTVPANESTASTKSYTVSVETVEPSSEASWKKTASFSFNQDKKPVPTTPFIRVSKVSSGNPSGTSISYTNDGYSPGDALQPHSYTDFTFYISTNCEAQVSSIAVVPVSPSTTITPSEASVLAATKLYDWNGDEITSGATAGQVIPSTDNTWKAIKVKIPANTQLGERGGWRRFTITFLPTQATQAYADVYMLQYGDQYYIDNIHWDTDQVTGTTTSYTLDSHSYIWAYDQSQSTAFEPQIHLMARKYNAAGTDDQVVEIGDSVEFGYVLANCGLDNSRISVTYPSWFVGTETPQTEGGSFCPSAVTPYAFNILANESYTPSPAPATRTGDIVITYSYGGTNVPLTIHVEQLGAAVTPPEADLYVYVQPAYGGEGRSLKEDDVCARTQSNHRQIEFSLTSGGDTGLTWVVHSLPNAASSIFSGGTFGEGYFGPSEVDTQCYSPHQWPGHSVDCILYLKDSVTNNFDMKIQGNTTDGQGRPISTILTLHVYP